MQATTANILPYMFRGGSLADYRVGVGPAGTYHTTYLPTRQTIQSVVPSPGQAAQQLQVANVLGAVNLGVNLLNLGVGVYNAYQLHRVRKELGQVRAAVDDVHREVRGARADIADLRAFTELSASRVESTLHDHSIILGLLYDANAATSAQLEHFREEVRAGFRDVFAAILSAEARAVRRQLETLRVQTLHHYRVLAQVLAAGRSPEASEIQNVVTSSVELSAWATTLIGELALGSPARLPLLVVRASALRMLSDAQLLQDPEHPSPDRERRQLATEVSQGAYLLVDGRSPDELTSGLDQILAGYVFLHRGLTERVYVATDATTGAPVPLLQPQSYSWNDGLDPMRNLASTKDARLLAEVASPMPPEACPRGWIERWREEYGLPGVPLVGDVLRTIGVRATGAVPLDALRLVCPLALSSGRAELASRYQHELGWQSTPRILPAGSDVTGGSKEPG